MNTVHDEIMGNHPICSASASDCDIIVDDRAGGTSQGSGKPPANLFPASKSLEPYIESLANAGFVDARTEESAYVLQRVPYSHLAYYFRIALSDANREDPSVKTVHDLMVFDRRFQSVTFKYIGIIESQLRAQYSHWMHTEFGEFPHHNPSLFTDSAKYDRTMKSYKSEVERAKRNNKVIRDIASSNGGKLPIGYAVQTMSFGVLSRLYANTASVTATRNVASSFGSTWGELSGWLRAVSDVRNVCAHFGAYLSRKQMPTTPKMVRGLDVPNNKPPYIAALLSFMLSEREPFVDFNLHYARQMRREYADIIRPFSVRYPYFMHELAIEEDWESTLSEASRLGVKAKSKAEERKL